MRCSFIFIFIAFALALVLVLAIGDWRLALWRLAFGPWSAI
jgi:hypothetical protein